jgi:acyl-homoserine lactone acylase PvdQ
VPGTAAAARTDFARQAYSILAPGQSGGLPPDANSTDQARLYDALTPRFGNVRAGDLRRRFKSERFGVQGRVVRTEATGRRGLRIVRDRFGVPHITGRTRADVFFGVGWVTAADRNLLIEQGRYPGRVSALDVPGVDAFRDLVVGLRTFVPSAQAEAFLARQVRVLRRMGPRGRRILRDIDAWLAGVNAWYARNRPPGQRPARWTRNDAVAAFSFVGSIFGAGGGREVANAELLAELRRRLGPGAGLSVFRDLREVNDPEATTTIGRRFPYVGVPRGATPGSAVIDPGSLSAAALRADGVAARARRSASNFLLVGSSRSASRRPLAVMGPQLGYFYPEIVFEAELHGGGIDARGAVAPVMPYVLIGRGKDFAWSLTSAGGDNTDEFLEELCNPDGSPAARASTHYRYKGACRAMTTVDAGTLKGAGGEPDRELVFRETVHGPVSGTVTVGGRPYAIARMRSTRGREPAGLAAFEAMTTNSVRSPAGFYRAANRLEYTFHWAYLDDRNIAYFQSGRLPRRAPGVDPSLPTLGTGRYDWRGFLRRDEHPHGANPRGGLLLNWNNKGAPGFGAADSSYNQGSVHRVELFARFGRRMRLHDLAGVMNRAATQDLRAVEVWPVIRAVLASGAPDARSEQAAGLIDAWRRRGASRLDRDGDGKVDDPGAAVLDATWARLGNAVLRPVLGDLVDDGSAFLRVRRRDDPPDSTGSAFDGGWYGYVDKDLHTILGRRVRGRFSRRYCGNGSLAACRSSLWAAFKEGVDALAAAQGPDPAGWRADANAERIRFLPGLISDTMRWTNRPTFQQAIEFAGHRARR